MLFISLLPVLEICDLYISVSSNISPAISSLSWRYAFPSRVIIPSILFDSVVVPVYHKQISKQGICQKENI